MAKKKQKTFAQRAEKIMKRYEARPDDKVAQESKNRELSALKEEQETYKKNEAIKAMETMNSMGYGDIFAAGGYINKYADGGEMSNFQQRQFQDWVNQGGDITGGYGWGPKSQAAWDKYGTKYQQSLEAPIATRGPQAMQTKSFDPAEGMADIPTISSPYGETIMSQDIMSERAQQFDPFLKAMSGQSGTGSISGVGKADATTSNNLGNEMNPYAALAQGVGDIYGLAKSFQKYDPRTAEALQHQRTDTTAQEEAIDRQMASAQMAAREGMRNLGPAGAKAAMSNMLASTGSRAGEAKANIISGAQQQDQRANLGIDQYNIGQRTQADEANRMARDARTMAQVGHMQNLGQTYAGYDKDSRANKYQNDVLSLMDTDNYQYVRDENGNLMAIPKVV